MNDFLQTFIQTSSTVEKGFFLMAAGILFVFAVQVIFYLTVKLWPTGKK
jgi:cell division protein FtsL